jgi:hypothetical protein
MSAYSPYGVLLKQKSMPVWQTALTKAPVLIAIAFMFGLFVSTLTTFASLGVLSVAGSRSHAAGVASSSKRWSTQIVTVTSSSSGMHSAAADTQLPLLFRFVVNCYTTPDRKPLRRSCDASARLPKRSTTAKTNDVV